MPPHDLFLQRAFSFERPLSGPPPAFSEQMRSHLVERCPRLVLRTDGVGEQNNGKIWDVAVLPTAKKVSQITYKALCVYEIQKYPVQCLITGKL